ncbi:betaine--homocysteine S-methyltransferase 1-like [Babylonia areolata]|uniref:betaine--homocysteine S-methyltransferase 1-like n=1 Tax=Babylonia areolata TaxID=304850 RepID=UPI003FD300A5
MKPKGLRERLADGESIICAEGYMWELEKRGYLKSGVFTPEVVLDHPERVVGLHEEYVHAGSDVVEAFTYYGNREKLRVVGREDELEQLNLTSLRLAKEVAVAHGCLMAGNLSNTTCYDPDDPQMVRKVREMFREQVEWAVKGEADYIIGETFNDLGEAKLALEAIKTYGNGLPAVITLVPYSFEETTDEVSFPEALRQLEEMGADVVGLNCGRGPSTMLPLLRQCRQVCKGPLAALPVPFRTTEKQKAFQALTDPLNGESLYPTDLSCVQNSRSDIREFARQARELGVQYVGLCCGSTSSLLREIAVQYGRQPQALKYAPDLKKSFVLGNLYGRSARVLGAMTGNVEMYEKGKVNAKALKETGDGGDDAAAGIADQVNGRSAVEKVVIGVGN